MNVDINMVTVPISYADLVDKHTILSIKRKRITDPLKLGAVIAELELLDPILKRIGISTNDNYYNELLEINKKLWHIENLIRSKEALHEFDEEFIELARNVYHYNDDRAIIKARINEEYGSPIKEVKEYAAYIR